MKRLFDLICSLAGLIILSPLFLVIAFLIKIKSPGPIFFKQERIGKKFRPFKLYKFRTMVVDAPLKGPQITVGGDERTTPIGRFLRRFKLDELPQLFNVLQVDMSIVGPRPEVNKYVQMFRKDYEKILRVRPGITDIASLTFRNEESLLKDKDDPESHYRNFILPDKLKLSKEYVNKASIIFDVKLILVTLLMIFYPGGLIERLVGLVTLERRAIVLSVEVVSFGIANYLAFFVRFDWNIPDGEIALFLKYLPVVILVRISLSLALSTYKGLWKYTGTRDVFKLAGTLAAGSFIILIAVRYIAGDTTYPKSIYVMDWFFNMTLLMGMRFLCQFHNKVISTDLTCKNRVIIIGAGNAAEMLIRDIHQNTTYPFHVVGLVDDNPCKKGLLIKGVPVLGTRHDLDEIVKKEEPEEFIVAIPSLSSDRLYEVLKHLRTYGLPIKVMPGMRDLLVGKKSIDELNAITPEDVLFRCPTLDEDNTDLKLFFKGKRIMITGAGGSIGSELATQVAGFDPACLILFERHEESLYKVDLKLRDRPYSLSSNLVSVIGDVLDRERVDEVMERFGPQIVFHAAAYKHVPLMESNPNEAFRTNVLGTRTVVEAARRQGVDKFVLISTDKAVNPVNVMGKTKKLAERVVRAYAKEADCALKCVIVRFGNVLGSSGSVVPLFRKQIKNGGPVTVTHPDIIRYFMTIPEAVKLTLHTSLMGEGGDTFVLDMGEPVKILDLARRMIELNGYKAGEDMDIIFTGLRPGEKMYEELFNKEEETHKTIHPKIRKAIQTGDSHEDLRGLLQELSSSGMNLPEMARRYLGYEEVVERSQAG